MIIPNIWENKIDVPNHQPDKLWLLVNFPTLTRIMVYMFDNAHRNRAILIIHQKSDGLLSCPTLDHQKEP